MKTIQRFIALAICSVALLTAGKPVAQPPTLDYVCGATNLLGECLAGPVDFLGDNHDRVVGVEVLDSNGASIDTSTYGTSHGVLSFTEQVGPALGTYTVNLYKVKGKNVAVTPYLVLTFVVGAPDPV